MPTIVEVAKRASVFHCNCLERHSRNQAGQPQAARARRGRNPGARLYPQCNCSRLEGKADAHARDGSPPISPTLSSRVSFAARKTLHSNATIFSSPPTPMNRSAANAGSFRRCAPTVQTAFFWRRLPVTIPATSEEPSTRASQWCFWTDRLQESKPTQCYWTTSAERMNVCAICSSRAIAVSRLSRGH